MPLLCGLLILLAFSVSVPATLLARAIGRRLNALDAPGVPGQLKAPPRRVPNTGGIGIFLGVALPIAAALAAVNTDLARQLAEFAPALAPHLPGLAATTTTAAVLLAGALALHIVGLIDDRRPLGPILKLVIMLCVAALTAALTGTRLFEFLDRYAGDSGLGRYGLISLAATVLWIAVVTNAFNFLDNMDGLAAGVGAICAAFFLIAALVASPPQWFVAAALAVLIGALAGFLVFNFPWRSHRETSDGAHRGGASVFMGDSGSLVLGFLLAFLSVRITYISPTPLAPHPSALTPPSPWYAALMPLVILAIPLYDFCSVVAIRLAQGKSPFVGDLQHFSHRLVRHGLSRRAAVVVIYGCTAVTAIGGVSLTRLAPWQAALVGLQTLLVLLVLALYEWKREP